MQTQGSLQESNLASLLQSMQSERATGTLSLDHAGGTANLYFLFGHLFHATGPDGGQGEPVVLQALNWHEGSFLFDPRAKLPAEETIKASPSDLIAQAGTSAQNGEAAVEAGPDTGAGFVPTQFEPTAAPAPDAAYAAGGLEPAPAAPAEDPMQHWTPVEQPQPAEVASWDQAPTQAWEAPPAEANTWGATAEAPAESWETNTWGAQSTETYQAEPAAGPAPAETPAPADFYAPPAEPAYTAPQPAPEPPPQAAVYVPSDIEVPMYPLSAGKPLYQGLKSAFVDFGKLLRTLRADGHTGYVRLTEDGGYTGILLFHNGHLYETVSTEDQPLLGEAGFMQFRKHSDSGAGSFDVVALNEDMVSALARAFTGTPFPMGLQGRFVNFPLLIEHLSEEKLTGSILVAGDNETGVILMQEGRLVSAYTSKSKNLSEKPDAVAALAAEPTARIEIKSTAGSTQTIDVEAALTRPY